MKKTILSLLIGLALPFGLIAQSESEKAVQQTITSFAKAGDQNNVEALEGLLDANYRVVMNRLFGSNEVSVVPRSVYLEKIRKKEWGGDQRKLTFDRITINGTSASAKVVMQGSKMTFVSLLDLIQDGSGEWKLISDTPMIK